MSKLKTSLMVGFVTFAIAATSTLSPASAGKRERRIATGIAIGALLGAVIADGVHRKKRRKHVRQHRNHRNHYRNHRRHYDDFDYDDDYVDRSDRHYQRPTRFRRVYDDTPRRVYRDRRPVYQERRINSHRAHTNWCHNQYRSYRQSDNTFQPYHGGRRLCISPFN